MAKVSGEAKSTYAIRMSHYKQEIDQIQKREKALEAAVERDTDPVAAGFKRIALAEDALNQASLFLLMNNVSMNLLGVKNEPFLNTARKSCYDSIIQLEKVVTDMVDAPFSEYGDKVAAIDDYGDDKKLALMRKLGFTIDAVKENFGDNSKWKWSFVDLEGRFATVCKNMINLKTFVANMEPQIDGYMQRVYYIRLTKEWMSKAADRYREKYELSTKRMDDFKMAINFVAAQRRLHMMLGEADQAESLKKKYDVWKTKMEDDEKKAASRPATGSEG